MLKIALTALMLPLLLLFGSHDNGSSNAPNSAKTNLSRQGESGTLQKMVVANGSVSMDIDLNRINGVNSTTRQLEALHFGVAPASLFSGFVFNKVLRRADTGSMGLLPQNNGALPAVLTASVDRLTIEQAQPGETFNMAVRDATSGFVFFN